MTKKYEWDRVEAASIKVPSDEAVGKWFDKLEPEERRMRFIEMTKSSLVTGRIFLDLGGGDFETGTAILDTITAHVLHADQAHPWGEDLPAKAKYAVALDEWEEYREQYYLAREHGLDDRDAPLCDEEKLNEHVEHMLYEAADLIAALVKILRG